MEEQVEESDDVTELDLEKLKKSGVKIPTRKKRIGTRVMDFDDGDSSDDFLGLASIPDVWKSPFNFEMKMGTQVPDLVVRLTLKLNGLQIQAQRSSILIAKRKKSKIPTRLKKKAMKSHQIP